MTNNDLGRIYSAPPIIEAIIQLHFEDAYTGSKARKLVERLTRRYDNHSSSVMVNAKVDFEKRTAEFDEAPQDRFTSADETDTLVIDDSAFTWARLAPYEGWEPFLARVSADLNIAHEITGPRKLDRIGVRYVNRLDVPQADDIIRYEDYLAINIEIPKQYTVIENYAWRFEREFPDSDVRAVVQSAVVEAQVPGCGSFMLDIDVVARRNLPLRTADIFGKLAVMRGVKNEIFELAIRDTARSMYS